MSEVFDDHTAPPHPLNQITNESPVPISERISTERGASHHEKTIRKARSSRSLRHQWLSSDESLGSDLDFDSIYNASPVLSKESLPEQLNPAADTETEASPPTVLSPSLSPGMPHSQWPMPQLSTIIEQNSIQSLRRSYSSPRLRDSPEKSPRVVQTQASIHSIHPCIGSKTSSPWPLKNPLPPAKLYKHRSFSVNDVDDMLKPRNSAVASPHSSSSSGGGIDYITQVPQYPILPVQLPPYRAPTPPGLPSFGSREAQTLRLAINSPRSFWHRIWANSSNGSDDQTLASPQGGSPPANSPASSPQMQPASAPSEMFKRTLAAIGMSRVVSPPPTSSTNARVTLPPGVHVSKSPGALVRADDGTFMRGRFNARASGHGVGSRTVESHPLIRSARIKQMSSIEEQVRAIDKACERAERESAFELQSRSSSAQATRGGPQSESENSSVVLAPHSTDNGVRSVLHPAASPPLTQQQQGGRISHPQRSSPVPVPRMRPPRGYSPVRHGTSVESRSRLPSIAEDARRERNNQQLLIEKRREQRNPWLRICYAMDGCCHDFWVQCCGCGWSNADVRGDQVRPERSQW